jgi:transcriptional regulator GlxA family with amidase domain
MLQQPVSVRPNDSRSATSTHGSAGAIPGVALPLGRGGLPPRTVRRIREYVDAHLEQNVDLESLARLADLSLYHFARAFKKSVGLPPHRYLLERRIERARELLADTNMPLAQIALAVGFSDQSHLTRRFHESIGTTPSTYRWNLR